MIVYSNGDSHAAAAECVNPHAFAEDDSMYWGLGRQPHPDNLRASYSCELANHLNAILVCDAESASSNDRIMRTTRNYLKQFTPELIVIQWSTWEREEWNLDDVYYQVTASGTDDVPPEYANLYKKFVIGIDWEQKTQEAHDRIWEFHKEILHIPHVFFNGNNHFEKITARHNWDHSYINPYDHSSTFDFILRNQGFSTVNPKSYHFGADAHCFWGEYLLQYIKNNNLI